MILICNYFDDDRHGAQEVDASERAGASGGSFIGGSGYRLGDGTQPSEFIRGPEKQKQPVLDALLCQLLSFYYKIFIQFRKLKF